jgi:hypothetical protein
LVPLCTSEAVVIAIDVMKPPPVGVESDAALGGFAACRLSALGVGERKVVFSLLSASILSNGEAN